MYKTEQKIIDAFNSNSREILVKAVFNNDYIVDGKYIKSFTISSSVGNTDALSLGNTNSSKLELDMFVPTEFTGLYKSKIGIYIGLEIDGVKEYVPLGVFFADDVKSTDNFKSVKITAFDAMLKINDPGNKYVCKISDEYVTPVRVINDIAQQAGVTINIGNSKEIVSDSYKLNAVGVFYSTTGIKNGSYDSLGITNLIPISETVQHIDVEIYGLEKTDLSLQSFRAVYFDDIDGNTLSSYKDYDSSEFTDTIDFDEEGNPYQYLSGTFYPTLSTKKFFGFHFDTSEFDVLPDIFFKVNVTYIQTNYVNGYSIENPGTVNYSPRTMLGYMAGLLGCNAVINRFGELTLKRICIDDFTVIPASRQFIGEYEQSLENPLTIEYVTTGTQPNNDGVGGIITAGSGSYGFNFENPYITTLTDAQRILDLYKSIKIMPCKVKHRGNPCIDCGDIIRVEDKNGTMQNLYVLSQTFSVSGGFNSTIDCSLKTDSKEDFISTPSNRKVTQVYTDFENAYQDIIGKLSGAKGGYVKDVYDSQNNKRAIAICENDIAVKWDSDNEKVVVADASDSTEPMWVWSLGGLRFTPDGGNTYLLAANMQGEFYAERIVGKLSKFVELEAEKGIVGGWTLDKQYLYSDYGNWRAFFQSVRAEAEKGTSPPDVWMLSAQYKQSDDTYKGLYVLFADGRVWHNEGDEYYSNGVFIRGLLDNKTPPKRGTVDNTVKMLGFVGNQIYLGEKQWQLNISDMFTIVNLNTQFSGEEKGINRYTILSSSNMTISANLGNSELNLHGKYIRSRGPHSFYDTVNFGYQVNFNGIPYFKQNVYMPYLANVLGEGNLFLSSSGQIGISTSAARFKENITDVISEKYNPEAIYDIPIKQFNYKKEYEQMVGAKGTQIGPIADDVAKIYPLAALFDKNGKVCNWNERIILSGVIKLLQDQHKQILSQQQRIDDLESRLSTIEKILTENQS